MKKLSKKTAADISSLFNSIDVAGIMKNGLLKKLDAGQITVASYNEDNATWTQHAVDAARTLYSRYGIVPVSFEEEVKA
jgi:hypothetical protein